MTNKQRINLIKTIQDCYHVDCNDHEAVRIRADGVVVKVQYNLKHGLGTGDIIGILSTNNKKIPSPEECDRIIVKVAEDYRDNLYKDYKMVDEELATIAKDSYDNDVVTN